MPERTRLAPVAGPWDWADGDTAAEPTPAKPLLRIGQLAKATGESNATLRFWTKEGLLQVADTTEANYQLYAPEMVERVAKIRDLQSQRFTLAEIKAQLRP